MKTIRHSFNVRSLAGTVAMLATAAQPWLPLRGAGSYNAAQSFNQWTQNTRCAVRQAPETAAIYVRSAPGSAAEAAAFRKMVDYPPHCDSYFMWNPKEPNRGFARGAVATNLYLKRFRARPIDLAARVARAKFDFVPFAEGGSVAVEEEIGRCLVRALPDAADAMTRAMAGSPEDDSTLARIMPSLPGCVVANTKIEINRYNLHAAIAAGLYQLASQ